jgi:hypothetical protein
MAPRVGGPPARALRLTLVGELVGQLQPPAVLAVQTGGPLVVHLARMVQQMETLPVSNHNHHRPWIPRILTRFRETLAVQV